VVSFVDPNGIRHSIEIVAESLYEAAALAVHEFRRHPWTEEMEQGAVTRLSVSVDAPKTTHELSIRRLEKWVSSMAESPKDTVLKGGVRELLKTNLGR
jgi:hypothetical protein